jgi:hypothetical protein
MRQIIIVIALIAIAAAPPGYGQSRQQGSTGTEQQPVLYDFRREPQDNPPKLMPGERERILSAVFKSYLKSADDCKSVDDAGDDYLAAARKAGQIVPDVVSVATGAFTAPGEQQTAYIISVGECNASHADNYGTKRLAIFSGPKLVADVDTDFQSGILRTLDLNGDGVNELLLVGGDINQGIAVDVATLVDFQGGQLRTIKDFGMTREDACASGSSGSEVRASIIGYTPSAKGQMPEFHVDNYRARCLRNGGLGRWTFLSSGKMPEQ